MGSIYNDKVEVKLPNTLKERFQRHYKWQGAISVVCRLAIQKAVEEAEKREPEGHSIVGGVSAKGTPHNLRAKGAARPAAKRKTRKRGKTKS